jgi:hypothetical protein
MADWIIHDINGVTYVPVLTPTPEEQDVLYTNRASKVFAQCRQAVS